MESDSWSSGLLQVRNALFPEHPTAGWAKLTWDALGQPWAKFTLWVAQGFMSDAYEWSDTWYLFANLVDQRVEILVDLRIDTDEISREHVEPMPDDETLLDALDRPDNSPPELVFMALCEAVRTSFDVQPVAPEALNWLRQNTPAAEPFDAAFAGMNHWVRPTW